MNIVATVTFSKAAKTVTFTGYTAINQRSIKSVVNATRGVIMYSAVDPALGGTVATNVLTLTLDTTGAGYADADIIQAIYDDPNANIPIKNTLPLSSDYSVPVSVIPSITWRSGFDRVYAANAVDTAWFTLLQTGSGQAVSQSAGSLVMTSGTTANSESVIRSVRSFDGNLTTRYSATLSQRIANNNFYIELVDVIGDSLAYTIGSATAVTVTIPSNPFTAANVGQSVYLGIITGAAGIPGRYAIASVSGNDVTFTVASWPGSGSGTISLFGWNYHHVIYNGTTATANSFDMQRNGWASGETTTVINTTASGHVGTIAVSSATGGYLDQTSASQTVLELTQRASRVRNIPSEDAFLYVQIRSHNGTTNPASTTTLTLGFIEVVNFTTQSVEIAGLNPISLNTALPVQVSNTHAVTVSSGTVTTVSTVTALTTLANGQTAHSSASTGSPLRIGGRVKTAVDTTLVAGDASDIACTTDQSLVVKPFSVPDLDWFSAAATNGISNTTTAVTIKAAAASGVRNYIAWLDISTDGALGAATEVAIRDGAAGTVIWRMKIGTDGIQGGRTVFFQTPIRGTAATLLEVVTLTASITGAVYINAGGYTAP